MKKQITYSIIIPLIAVLLSGCHTVGAKTASISYIYGTTAMLSLILLISYCWLIKKKNAWGFLLFSSVLVVNIGYFCLSISKTLEEALLANRIAYLGSVFLPMAILMIILDTSNLSYKKWFPTLLLIVGFLVFLVAASPGYLNIYYKEVALDTIRGATCLRKTYGSWHILYLIYLLCYMCGMFGAISYALIKKKIESVMHTVILVCAASVNWGVWLIEQLVEIEFEILSISYIITELFLLGLTVVMSENEKLKELVKQNQEHEVFCPTSETSEKQPNLTIATTSSEGDPKPHTTDPIPEQYALGLTELTRTERLIYDFYIEGKTTKEILLALDIKENTLKFHNKNIYSKLGVSSRKQLVEINQHHP